jgi:hypothetical protein
MFGMSSSLVPAPVYVEAGDERRANDRRARERRTRPATRTLDPLFAATLVRSRPPKPRGRWAIRRADHARALRST